MEDEQINILQAFGLRLVPELPTLDMCRAGSMIGEIDIDTTRRIYAAMLVIAADVRLHGDNQLH